MQPNPGPGRFIVIEGLDGAGTTTQAGLLGDRLANSRSVYVTYEPTDGPAGLQIRMVLEHRLRMDPAALAALFAADRMDHLYHRDGGGGIVPRLLGGTDVISDRYYLSSLVYQGMDVDWDWIWQIHARCIRPDRTIFVDVPVDVCLSRIAAGRGGRPDLYERRETLARVREGYLRNIDRLRQEGEAIAVVDGDAPLEEVRAAIWVEVAGLF
jgi:dTMP kinase